MHYTSARELLADRADFLRIRVVPSDPPGAWDITLTLDAGYTDHDTAIAVAQSFGRDLNALLVLEDITPLPE